MHTLVQPHHVSRFAVNLIAHLSKIRSNRKSKRRKKTDFCVYHLLGFVFA